MRKYAGLALLALIVGGGVAKADPYEDHLYHLHRACQDGNRGACVKFGIELGRHQERDAEWRHHHPEWYWYEH